MASNENVDDTGDWSDTSDIDADHWQDRTRTARCEIETDAFNRINKIRRDRGATWKEVIYRGIADLESDVDPFYDRFEDGIPSAIPDTGDDDTT